MAPFNGTFLVLSLALLVVATTAQNWSPSQTWCPKYSGIIFSRAVQDARQLEYTIDQYRKTLGGKDNGNNPSQPKGHRSINWDADVVPFNMPPTFFKNIRGAEFLAVEGAFAVSNPPYTDPSGVKDNQFSSFNPNFPKLFRTFSPPRLFTPVKSNELITVFSVPGSKNGDKAIVSGFGAIFTNVAKKWTTFLHYYDENECLIFRLPVKDFSKGLSFGGIIVTRKNGKKVSAAIASVKIVLGDGIISKPWSGKNFVVLDDLIYGEPKKLGHGNYNNRDYNLY